MADIRSILRPQLTIKMKYFIPVALSLSLISCERNSISWQEINAQIEHKFSSVPHVSVDQFVSEFEDNDDILLIDVREAEEFAVSHIPGAVYCAYYA